MNGIIKIRGPLKKPIKDIFFFNNSHKNGIVFNIDFIGWKRVHLKYAKPKHNVKLVIGHDSLSKAGTIYVKRRHLKRYIKGGYYQNELCDYVHLDPAKIRELGEQKWFAKELTGRFDELYDIENVYLAGNERNFVLFAQTKDDAKSFSVIRLNLNSRTLWKLVKNGQFVTGSVKCVASKILQSVAQLAFDNQGTLVEIKGLKF